LSTVNEIANEARAIATAPAVDPGAQPAPLVVAELIRNLAALVADLAEQVESLQPRG
jgi:hypothetical protein